MTTFQIVNAINHLFSKVEETPIYLLIYHLFKQMNSILALFLSHMTVLVWKVNVTFSHGRWSNLLKLNFEIPRAFIAHAKCTGLVRM